ncbi:MAG TPA: hypothetical protein VN088_13810 [Nocardioides sp.]|nr:hypothetical protein [Nocardioides sp.]
MNPAPIVRRQAAWHWENQWLDTDTGEVFDFTARGDLTITSTIRDNTGKVYATLNNRGTGDGTLTGGADGLLEWDLPEAVVNTLPITRTYRGKADPRVATWRNRGLLVFDLVVDDGVNDPWTFFDGQLVVCAAITT